MKHQDFDILKHFLQRGGSLRMLADIDSKDLHLLYQYAQQLMRQNEPQGAKRILYLLTHLDHWHYGYYFALGLCYQQVHEHEEALFCFARAGTIEVDNPLPAYHAGLSYLALGNKLYATKSLKASLRWCKNRSEYAVIAAHAQQGLTQLIQESSYVN